MNYLFNYKAVYRTAPATPGLLKKIHRFLYLQVAKMHYFATAFSSPPLCQCKLYSLRSPANKYQDVGQQENMKTLRVLDIVILFFFSFGVIVFRFINL